MLCLRSTGGMTPGAVWPGAGVPTHAWRKIDLHHLGHIAEHRVTTVFENNDNQVLHAAMQGAL